MPWLRKQNNDNDNAGENPDAKGTEDASRKGFLRPKTKNLLFVHVPRTGGTSLTKAHGVASRAVKSAPWKHKWGMALFFYSYGSWERANFPVWSGYNAVCAVMVAWNLCLRWFVALPEDHHHNDDDEALSAAILRLCKTSAGFNTCFFLLASFFFSFVFVAPCIGRFLLVRRLFLVTVHYIFFGSMDSREWITGTNIHGYLLHLTAHKMLAYGYVTPEELETAVSVSVVRNPYSRMVSLYMYNRLGPGESFSAFVDSWYETLRDYRESGVVEEWQTHCHALPQFEYTHFEGHQLVQCVVKLEELGDLVRTGDEGTRAGIVANNDDDGANNHEQSTGGDDGAAPSPPIGAAREKPPPEAVRQAVSGMPHVNQRKTPKPWYEYYDQATLNKTYELYGTDFTVFEYRTTIDERPDLLGPSALAEGVCVDDNTGGGVGGDSSRPLLLPPPRPPIQKFSRNLASSEGSPEQEKRRKALLSRAVGVSPERSSMFYETKKNHNSNNNKSNERRSKGVAKRI
mmetsp:Transcript_5440/g.11451  ORF Transcript_5440/g.11451 Transcript_5440/m.11451 type:complete len:514 (+) Transcript_5440:915-2456(+)